MRARRQRPPAASTPRRSRSSRLRDSHAHAHADPQDPNSVAKAARLRPPLAAAPRISGHSRRPIREGQVLLLRRSRLPQQQPGARSRNGDVAGASAGSGVLCVLDAGRRLCPHFVRLAVSVVRPRDGIATSMRVPRPGGLSIWICPPSASIRSVSPVGPEPWLASAPPTPSSRIERSRASSSTRRETHVRVAFACLHALVRASETVKYAAAST